MQNNKEHRQNEGPIHLAFLHVLAFSGLQRGENKTKNLMPFWRHLVDFGSHFGAHWMLKAPQSDNVLRKSTRKEKSGVQEGVLNKKQRLDLFSMPPKLRKYSFRIIHVAILRALAGREYWWKMELHKASNIY